MQVLTIVAWTSLAVALSCALFVAADVAFARRQKMAIMNIVWPVTMLYAGALGLWAYLRFGRAQPQQQERMQRRPDWQAIALATTHCGSGCTLGDIIAEWGLVLMPFAIFGHKIFAAWAIDYVCAFLLGIVFQYFTIVPMRNLSFGKGVVAAVKADALSLTAWQVGMYGWMALATFAIFGRELAKTDPVFWFMMQIAMLCGLLTAWPINRWLLRAGLKERM